VTIGRPAIAAGDVTAPPANGCPVAKSVVHAVEGIGNVTTHAIREDDTVLLGVQLTSPVQATFAVAFSYELHQEFLNEVADAGTLVFATTDTETAHEEHPLWLSVFIDGAALRQTLQMDLH